MTNSFTETIVSLVLQAGEEELVFMPQQTTTVRLDAVSVSVSVCEDHLLFTCL